MPCGVRSTRLSGSFALHGTTGVQAWKLVELPWEEFHKGGNHMSSGTGMPDWDKIFWIAFDWFRDECPTTPLVIDDLRYLRAE